MDITHDGDRSADVHHVGFAHENLLCFLAYFAKQCLVQELFPEELLDASFKVKGGHEVSRVIVGNLRKGCRTLSLFRHPWSSPPLEAGHPPATGRKTLLDRFPPLNQPVTPRYIILRSYRIVYVRED